MNGSAAVALVVAMFATPANAFAQTEPGEGNGAPAIAPVIERTASRGTFGAELGFLVPRGDFTPGHTLSFGYGVRGGVALGARKIFDIGAAFRSVAHDSRTYADTVKVKNMLRSLTVNGRIVAPLRHARPYLGASVGAAYFGTEKSIERCCNEEGDRDWELDEFSLVRIRPAASARVGLLVDLFDVGGKGPSVMSLDLGVEDHYGRRTTYQTGGSGPIVRTGTSYRVYSLGISVRGR